MYVSVLGRQFFSVESQDDSNRNERQFNFLQHLLWMYVIAKSCKIH